MTRQERESRIVTFDIMPDTIRAGCIEVERRFEEAIRVLTNRYVLLCAQ
jgi:hypothetical protein